MNNNLPMQYVYNGLAEIHFRGQRHKVKNYQEWDRAAFTISVGLKHFGIINLHQYKLRRVNYHRLGIILVLSFEIIPAIRKIRK